MLAFTRYLTYILPIVESLLPVRKKLICHLEMTNQFSLHIYMVPIEGLEPPTSSLPWMRSTA